MDLALFKSKPSQLACLAISSTLFLSVAFADVTVNTAETAARSASVDDNITIAPSGSITVAGVAVNMDKADTTLTLDNNNGTPNLGVLSTTSDGVRISQTGVTIMVGTGATRIKGQFDGIDITAGGGNAKVDNSGTIEAVSNDGIDSSGVNLQIFNRSGGTIVGEDGIVINNGANTLIINESGAMIESNKNNANSSAIQFQGGANTGTINNTGIIKNISTNNSSGTIYAFSGGFTGAINNNEGAEITAAGSHAIGMNSNGLHKLVVNNAGTVTAAKNGIYFFPGDTNTGDITNQGTGVINAGTGGASGSGILFQDNLNGDILNDGIITAFDSGIQMDASSTTNITNNKTITVTGTNTGGGININGAGTVLTGNVTNNAAGSISVTGNQLNAIRVQGKVTGNINNAGSLTSNFQSTLLIDNAGGGVGGDVINTGSITQSSGTIGAQAPVRILQDVGGKFDNQGSITQNLAATPAVFIDTALIPGGFSNSGTISTVAGGEAVRIQSDVNFTQTAGTITGNFVNQGNNTTDTFTGGTLTGNLTQINNSTLNVENTTITGNITGGGANNTLNVTNNFSTPSTSTISGYQTLNVNAGTFTANGPINTANVAGSATNINAGTTLMLNNTFTHLAGGNTNTVTVQPGATLYVTAPGKIVNTGPIDVVNKGTITIDENAPISVNSVNDNLTGGVYNITLTDTTKHSKMLTTGGDVLGDTFNLSMTGKGLINNGDTFVLMSGATANNAAITLSQPASQTISFVPGPGANVDIVAVRTPFGVVGTTPNGSNVAAAIDNLLLDPGLNPDMKFLVSQLDTMATKTELNDALDSLVPDASGGLVEISQTMHNRNLHTVEGRIDQARAMSDLIKAAQAGDAPYYGMGAWGKVYATSSSQKDIDVFKGYTATTLGLVAGVDKSFSPNLSAGVAMAYTSGDVDSRGLSGNELDVRGLQFIGYSSYIYDAWYLDFMVSAGLNTYKSKRQINIGTLSRVARADYKAWQYTGKFETGYNIANGKYRIVPVAGLQYSMLDLDGYTESTAGGISLAVEPRNVPEVLGTVGLRLAALNEYVEALYVPEFRAFMHYDFLRDNLISTSNFVSSGGVFFESRSAKPDPLTFNLGGALTAYTNKVIFSASYDLEFRKQYIGHYGSFKLRYEW